MKTSALALGCALLLPLAAWSDRGDVFMTLGPAVDILQTDDPAAGAFANVQFGVNEKTDLQVEIDATANSEYFDDDDGDLEIRYLFGSLFTPYFGDFRPRFGASAGFIQINQGDGDVFLYANAGINLQALWQASDTIRLFVEAHPNLTFGSAGEFSTLVKAGLQFRLSK